MLYRLEALALEDCDDGGLAMVVGSPLGLRDAYTVTVLRALRDEGAAGAPTTTVVTPPPEPPELLDPELPALPELAELDPELPPAFPPELPPDPPELGLALALALALEVGASLVLLAVSSRPNDEARFMTCEVAASHSLECSGVRLGRATVTALMISARELATLLFASGTL